MFRRSAINVVRDPYPVFVAKRDTSRGAMNAISEPSGRQEDMRAANPEAWAPVRPPLSAQHGGEACFIAVFCRDDATATQPSSFLARFTTNTQLRYQGRPHDCRTLDSCGRTENLGHQPSCGKDHD
jgi:hypothetical protein